MHRKKTRRHMLTEAEVRRLIMALGAGGRGFTEGHVQAVVRWAEEICLGNELLDGVLQGHVGLTVQQDVLAYHLVKLGGPHHVRQGGAPRISRGNPLAVGRCSDQGPSAITSTIGAVAATVARHARSPGNPC